MQDLTRGLSASNTSLLTQQRNSYYLDVSVMGGEWLGRTLLVRQKEAQSDPALTTR